MYMLDCLVVSHHDVCNWGQYQHLVRMLDDRCVLQVVIDLSPPSCV